MALFEISINGRFRLHCAACYRASAAKKNAWGVSSKTKNPNTELRPSSPRGSRRCGYDVFRCIIDQSHVKIRSFNYDRIIYLYIIHSIHNGIYRKQARRRRRRSKSLLIDRFKLTDSHSPAVVGDLSAQRSRD